MVVKGRLHSEVCREAYDSGHKPVAVLLEEQIEGDAKDEWTRARHFVGRLGHLESATHFVVQNARRYAFTIQDCEVKSIPHFKLEKPLKLRLDDDLEQLVLQVFPEFSESPLCGELGERLQKRSS
ncbi:hypothetical protein LTR95_007979, partial [Oleoguttula sp. CCFEE 5521]